MKKHLNTLFVTTQGAYLAKDGETVLVRVEKETRLRVPIHNLAGIVCFGSVSCSPYLLGFCGRRGVAITFLSEYGRFLARVLGPTSGNVLLRREQYRRTDHPQETAEIARALVTAKVASSREVLARAVRARSEEDEGTAALREAVVKLKQLLGELGRRHRSEAVTELDHIRGIEGAAARAYFQVFDHLILQQKTDFHFESRSRRPPLDPVNALLSFCYTLLRHDIEAALETVGLDPAVGYLHRERPGRPSLALDLMEEFRAFFADRLVLSLINLKQIQSKGFEIGESGAVRMHEETRKELLAAYQKRKQVEVMHPFLNEKTTIGMLFHLQALLFARYLRGDLDGYPPFVLR